MATLRQDPTLVARFLPAPSLSNGIWSASDLIAVGVAASFSPVSFGRDVVDYVSLDFIAATASASGVDFVPGVLSWRSLLALRAARNLPRRTELAVITDVASCYERSPH